MTPREVNARLPEVLGVCDLEDVAAQPIATLSHGYKQRVGIAQAIVHAPKVLILDEPIQGLDPVQIVEMRAMIRRLRGQHTVLLSTHILSEIAHTCDRILMLHKGRIAAQGSEAALAAQFGATVRFTLEALGAVDSVRAALGAVSGLTIEAATQQGDTVTVTATGTEDLRVQASRALVKAGIGLLSLTRGAVGLEKIFVSLSQGEIDGDASYAADTTEAP